MASDVQSAGRSVSLGEDRLAGPTSLAPLRSFIRDMTVLIQRHGEDEAATLQGGAGLLAALIAQDGWLPDFCASPGSPHYRQYLLYCDPLERFSVVSFVWGPGQKTPVHDHGVWGLVGVLRGAEIERRYDRADGAYVAGSPTRLEMGHVAALPTADGGVHQVANAYEDRVSVSIHVYGGNIGKVERRVLDPRTGSEMAFISGYSNDVLPNPWQ